MTERLFPYVKRKLNVTWSDSDTDDRITEIIESAIPAMIRKLGIADSDFDFSAPGEERTLFVVYCFYEWNHALNEFEDNYANQIAQVRAVHAVDYFESREESTDAK